VALSSLLAFGLVWTMPVHADELYASIRGNVTDQSGALVPDARITATNVAKGWTISGITTFQSGVPMDVIDSSNWSLHNYPGNSDFAGMDVPNLIRPIQ
jgi:hypothetical protein